MFSRAIVSRWRRTIAVGDERRPARRSVAAVLDVVEGCRRDRQARLVGLVPLGDPRVEVPAVVVEARRRRRAPHVLERDLLELCEADDDVGDLDAGVVDVVLDLDGHAAEAQHADQRVAEGGVAEVADVRRLVRIDGGVLDDGLAFVGRRGCAGGVRQQTGRRKAGAVEKAVQVAVRRGFDAREALDRRRARRRAPARSSAAALRSRRASSNATGTAEIAERAVRRVVDRDERLVGRRKAVDLGQPRRDGGTEPLMDWKNHAVRRLTGPWRCGTIPDRFHARRRVGAWTPQTTQSNRKMRDAGIGRLMVASLHQGIADRLPDRLEFYENWLNPQGLRDGTIGLAPLHAVLSFLRTGRRRLRARDHDGRRVRGAVGRQRVVRAEALVPRPGCRALAAADRPQRGADAHHSGLHRQPHPSSGAQEDGHPRDQELDLLRRARPRAPTPLCQFHAAAIARVLKELGIPAQTTIVACQATGDGSCRVEIDMARRDQRNPHEVAGACEVCRDGRRAAVCRRRPRRSGSRPAACWLRRSRPAGIRARRGWARASRC